MPSLLYTAQLIRQKLSPPRDLRPSFPGRTALITGANKGIGFEAAIKLLQCDCERVILGVRSIKQGEDAAAAIEAHTGRKGVIQVWHLDMSDYNSIRSFAARVEKELDKLDFAILNAGISSSEYFRSQYGWENTLQVNTVSTALLALLLLPKLRSSRTPEFTPVLEFVGSSNHYEASISAEMQASEYPLQKASEEQEWSILTQLNQYNPSKLFLMCVQDGIVRLLQDIDSSISLIVVCPGAVYSDMAKGYSAWYMVVMTWIARVIIMKSAEQGARTYVSGLALGKEGHGKFWQADQFRVKAPQLYPRAYEDLQAKVWKEVMTSLERDVPEVKALLARLQ